MMAMIALVIALPSLVAWIVVLLCTALLAYCLVSPLFGYVELREDCVWIRCGFFLKKQIPYERIRTVTKERKWYSDSMISLKNAFEHINIKYNTFDLFSVSVVENEELMEQIMVRVKEKREAA